MDSDRDIVTRAIEAEHRARRLQRAIDAFASVATPASLALAVGVGASGAMHRPEPAVLAAASALAAMAVAAMRAARQIDPRSRAALALDRRLDDSERCATALACIEGESRSPLAELIIAQSAECVRTAGERGIARVVWPSRLAGAAAGCALAAIAALWPWPAPVSAPVPVVSSMAARLDLATTLNSLGAAAEHPAIAAARAEASSPGAGEVHPSTAAAAAGAVRRLDAVREWADALGATLAPSPTRAEAREALDRAIEAARRGTLSPTDVAAAQVACPLPEEAISEFPASASAAQSIETALDAGDQSALAEALTALRQSLPPREIAIPLSDLAAALGSRGLEGGSAVSPGVGTGQPTRPGTGRPSMAAGPTPTPGATPDFGPTADFVLRSDAAQAEALRRRDWPTIYDECVKAYFEPDSVGSPRK